VKNLDNHSFKKTGNIHVRTDVTSRIVREDIVAVEKQ